MHDAARSRAEGVSVKKPQQQISIDLGEEQATGTYANLAIISHSQAEFILDFARLLPGLPKSKVVSRIIMTPPAAKALVKTLQANLERFEATHGEIRSQGQTPAPGGIGFQTGE
jgi:hypothetical protein